MCINDDDDIVNVALEKAKAADAFIIGSPVHFAAGSGQLKIYPLIVKIA